MRLKIFFFVFAAFVFCGGIGGSVFAQPKTNKPVAATTKTAAARSITIVAEQPDAIVWIDDVRRGVTDTSGRLVIKTVPAGVRRLRVRAEGFKEVAQTLAAAQKGEIKITLVKTTDEAELAFQQAEAQAATDREKSVELYRKALRLRPRFAEAQLGLARVLSESGESEQALKALGEARKIKPVYPEATAVEGRIYRSEGDDEKAIAAFNRAIREGKGFQPEANAGLALLYKERAEGFGSENNLEEEKSNYALATAKFITAIQQLSGAPDAEILYQLLGVTYEKQQKYADAIKVYEEFLRVFPDSPEATAVRSFIVQAQKQLKMQN
jgi:tetratricopeptide (TPR) repeat protein